MHHILSILLLSLIYPSVSCGPLNKSSDLSSASASYGYPSVSCGILCVACPASPPSSGPTFALRRLLWPSQHLLVVLQRITLFPLDMHTHRPPRHLSSFGPRPHTQGQPYRPQHTPRHRPQHHHGGTQGRHARHTANHEAQLAAR